MANTESTRARQPRRTRVVLFGIVRRSLNGIGSGARSGSTSGRSLRGRCCGVRNGTHGSCGHSRRLCNRGTNTTRGSIFRLKSKRCYKALCRSSGSRLVGSTRRRSARLVNHGAYAGHIAAVLEILGGSHAHGPRARIAYAGLHGPTDSRHKTCHLTRNRATRKPAAYNGRKLLHSVG